MSQKETLQNKTVAELRRIAKGLEHEAVTGYSTMRKAELVDAILRAQGTSGKTPPAGSGSHSGKVGDRVTATRNVVQNLKHQVHRFQDSIRRFEEDATDLRRQGNTSAAKKIEQRTELLKTELTNLEAEAARFPDIAEALGLAPTPSVDPPPITEAVEPARFQTFEFEVRQQEQLALSPLRSDWPRSGQVIKDGRLVPMETVGKLRLKLRDSQGRNAAGMPFQVTAKDSRTGNQVTLRRGTTDGHGYAAVNLGNISTERLDDIAIVVDGGKTEQDSLRHPIVASDLAIHRDLRIPHEVTLQPEALDRLRDAISEEEDSPASDRGTIEDPDDADLQNSPASFGLNEEHVDGNCCLRPRAEVAAREYHFRQIVRWGDADLVLGDKPEGRREVAAPIPFGDENPGSYSVKGGNLIVGTVNKYRQGWHPVGRGLGELLYSLALAPCEQVNLAFIDWSREEIATRRESRVAREQMEHELNRDRSIDEVVESVLQEQQSGSSVSGGGGASLDLGFFSIGGGGGASGSSTSGRRELQASTVQNVSDNISQKASTLRSQRATVVTTSSQQESERIQTRTVHNHNRNHALTVQYFQVVSHYSAKTELVEEKPVLLVPYEIDQDIFDNIPSFEKFVLAPARPITRFLDRHSHLLRRMVPRAYRQAFESLSRLLHCRDVYEIEQPHATFSHWKIRLDKAWRTGLSLSIETGSGQSVPLTPRGGRGGRQPVDFVSDPVRTDDIEAMRIGFDPVEAARAAGNSGIVNILGDQFSELLENTIKHKISRIDVSTRTDRSRFVPTPQTFRLQVDQPDTTLSSDNPYLEVDVAPPTVSFEGYRGREHRDYCRLKELIAYIQAQPMRFLRAIWYHEDPDRRALRLDRYSFQGSSLLDSIVNRPVGVLGNYVAFELLDGHRLVQLEEPGYTVSSRLVSLPTHGVFAEVSLSCCNATEKRDVERFIDPEQACQVRAPEITGITPGSRASRPDTTPTSFPSPIVSVQNASGIPDPTGMSSAMGVMGTPDIFRDLSRGAELLQFIDNATKEAFTSTREHRAAMNEIAGDILRGIVSAKTGVPIPGGSGNSGGTSGSGTSGITPDSEQGSGRGSPLDVMASQMARQTEPSKVSDHVQTIRKAKNAGLLDEEQANRLTEVMLGGSGGSNVQQQRTPAVGRGRFSFDYRVPGEVHPVRQPSSMTCWAASLTMLHSWRDQTSYAIEEVMDQIGENYRTMFDNNEGLSPQDIPDFLEDAALVGEPPMNYTPEGFLELLRHHGPLWVVTDENPADNDNFLLHARVVTRFSGNTNGVDTRVYGFDPDTAAPFDEPYQFFAEKFQKYALNAPENWPLFIQILHLPEGTGPQ